MIIVMMMVIIVLIPRSKIISLVGYVLQLAAHVYNIVREKNKNKTSRRRRKEETGRKKAKANVKSSRLF